MDFTTITLAVADGVAELTLNRPKALNSLTKTLIDEMRVALGEAAHDAAVKVLLITGAGRGFCAGADMLEPAEPGAIPGSEGMGELGFVYRFQEYLARAVLAIHECDKPVIAAIRGAAVGGGLALALASDIRIAADDARLGAVFLKTGLSNCDVGTSYLLPRLVGAGIAAELMLTGRLVEAPEAQAIGLANRVVMPEELDSTALAMARAIAENAEYGVWMTKKGLRAALDAPSLRHAMEMENRTQVLGYFTGAMTAMREAFGKGEKPDWPKL